MNKVFQKIFSGVEIVINKINCLYLGRIKVTKNGLSDCPREVPVIVSLTSYPGRINIAYRTIKTILTQIFKPDRVILWLSDEQFKGIPLPNNLTELEQYGLEIRWCEDIKSYKKLIPTLKEFPEAIIVTADDDNYYSSDWLDKLYTSYTKNPECISAHKVTKFIRENGEWKWQAGGRYYYQEPSFLNKLVGVGGVLYPPNCLYKDVCNSELFMELAPTNDDQWFWFMAILSNTKIKVVDNPIIHSKPVEGSLSSGLWQVNDRGDNLFRDQFRELLLHYPEAERRMLDECRIGNDEG